jgi:hypothetical protein
MGFPVSRTTGIETQELEGELMIMDAQADRVHVLNPTMAAVFRLCDGTRGEDTIAHALAESFDCSGIDDLMGSVREALCTLEELSLLCPGGDSAELE